MDDLQYNKIPSWFRSRSRSFKPCYKWMTFNTVDYQVVCDTFEDIVLNLVING